VEAESTPPDTWEFGQRVNHACQQLLRRPEPSYHLNLDEHSGVIVGQTEKGLLMSLLQLARLAASHGWKVVLFDPQTSEDRVAPFVATVQAAGCPTVSQFPGKMRLSDQGTLPYVLRSSLNQMLVDRRSAAYVGVHVWNRPGEAHAFARLLLGDLMRNVQKQDTRLLLLLKHPELLFELEQILPLFAALEQVQGSLFVAARSLADFGKLGPAHVRNARTVIVHRSNPSPHFISCIGQSWGHFFDRTVRALPDNECFVLHEGKCTHVRVKPVNAEKIPEEVVPPVDLRSFDEDYDDLFAYLFGPGETKKRASLRSASDKVHLRRALAMLGYEDLEH
jgi:hypothetical protein